MTSSPASRSAMARRPLAVLLGILALAAVGECLNCGVCIPAMVGDKLSQKEAARWRANISRTFPNLAESDIKVCGEVKTAEIQTASCPWQTHEDVCLGITHGSQDANNYWWAYSCGRIGQDEDMACTHTPGGAKICACVTENCNTMGDHSRGWRDAAVSAALVSALIGIALAAAW